MLAAERLGKYIQDRFIDLYKSSKTGKLESAFVNIS